MQITYQSYKCYLNTIVTSAKNIPELQIQFENTRFINANTRVTNAPQIQMVAEVSMKKMLLVNVVNSVSECISKLNKNYSQDRLGFNSDSQNTRICNYSRYKSILMVDTIISRDFLRN